VSEVVKLERHDEVGIVTVDSPPVNALSAAVRGGILECIKAAIAEGASWYFSNFGTGVRYPSLVSV